MAKTGRPKKNINKKEFESLLEIQCTLEEVTGFFSNTLDGCSEDTIERWCKSTYGESFADISKKKREKGKTSLRRNQFNLSKKNASMAIWLGKQYLGQTDKPANDDNTAMADAMKALADIIQRPAPNRNIEDFEE